MENNIFLTGGTGFLGNYIIRELLITTDSIIYLLIRTGKYRLRFSEVQKNILNRVPKRIARSFKHRLKIVAGDLTKINFGLENEPFLKLTEAIDEIYHLAATTDLGVSQVETRLVNVLGTKNVLNFASQCNRIRKLNHISTVFIAGNLKGDFSENDFYLKQGFNNFYEQSKFEGEGLIRDFKKANLNIKIYRPSMIMGEYDTGISAKHSTFNKILNLFYKEFFDIMPLNLNSYYNVIPVDIAAKAIVILASNSEEMQTYHIISKQNIRLGDLLSKLSHHLRVQLPAFVSVKDFKKKEKSIVKKVLISPFIPYLNIATIFRSVRTIISLDKENFKHCAIDIEYFLRNIDECLKK